MSKSQMLSLDAVKKRIFDAHGDEIEIIGEYKGRDVKTLFRHKTRGEFYSRPRNVFGGSGFSSRFLTIEEVRTKIKTAHGDEIELVGEYFNKNKIKYTKEPKAFKLEVIGKTYTPDFYLPEQDLYIDAKGRVYPTFAERWEVFSKLYPTAQIWDKKVLTEMGIFSTKRVREIQSTRVVCDK